MAAAGFLHWGLGCIIQAGGWKGTGEQKEAEHNSGKVLITISASELFHYMFLHGYSSMYFLLQSLLVGAFKF